MRSFTFLSFFLPCTSVLADQFKIYQPKEQVIFGGAALTLTATAQVSNFTSGASYDKTVLTPPAIPSPAIPTQIPIQLASSGVTQNISRTIPSGFMGFSIEMSVANQVLGKSSALLNVPFLNLLENIKERAGWCQVRVGGNSQEMASLVTSLPNGTMIAKNNSNTFGLTGTPPLEYTIDLFYAMSNISHLTNTYWYLGLPFGVSGDVSLAILEQGQSILGSYVLAFQAGNEPDLYSSHGRRPSNYSQYDYYGEIGAVVQQINNDAAIPKKDNILIVPSVQILWTPESIWDTGIVSAYNSSLYALAVERYPTDNCAALYPNLGPAQVPQAIFGNFLGHSINTNLVQSYINSSAFAQQNGKPFMMFETNSGSCAGFAGISNSFGAGLWAIDWAMTMAANGFTSALFHVGGQNAYYNAFTPPPGSQIKYGAQWTVGAVYYSALVMAEVIGRSNLSQISDITTVNNASMYAVYENGAPTKVALLNFVTDTTGASTYHAVISVGGGSTGTSNAIPSQVQVKYFLAPSVSSHTNLTWAGQSLGDPLKSDGRLSGTLNVTTIQCDQTANTCTVPVPAPGFALVFLTSQSLDDVTPTSTVTFPTTVQTGNSHVYIDPSMLATSYGHSGMENVHGATSQGSISAASTLHTALSYAFASFASALGVAIVFRRW